MPRLISRLKQIPNGFRFYEPITKWSPPPFASFNTIVTSLLALRASNPALKGQPTDYSEVADEVDSFNAELCKKMGWADYYIDGAGESPPPKPLPPPQNHSPTGKVKNVVAGAEILVEWIKDGGEAVPKEQSEARAKICVDCPKNSKGDWTSLFTVPVAKAIGKELSRKNQMQLSTKYDSQLGVCGSCGCPLQLKTHVPLDKILSRTSEDVKTKLDPRCWILNEQLK